MADAPKLVNGEMLKTAFPKMNQAIDNANEALSTANSAKTTAADAVSDAQRLGNEAKNIAKTAELKADSVQTQFNQVMIEGDSSVEAAQARVNADGTSFTTLQERLNTSDAKMADKAAKTDVDNLKQQLVPKRYIFGGQLEKLKYALSNPLEQFTGICFVGDSITWGLGATGNPTDYNTGRDGTLSDIRDNFASESFVNDFKRYIGSKYMGNVAPVLSNWQYSTVGQAIAIYTKQHILYPFGGDFSYSTTGTIFNSLSNPSSGSLTGFQWITNVESSKDGVGIISFPFTGEEFTISYDCVNNSMSYELFVDGVSQGVFSTTPGEAGNVAGYNNQRTHTFPYIRNKTIQIKSVKNSYVGTQTLRISAIIVNKKIRITNQGIIGTKAYYYKSRNMTGNTSNDGVAVGSRDNYIFCQLGSNDRMIETAYAKGSNEFKKNLKLLVDELKTFGEVIMMVANPAANESASSFSFNMQDARNVVYRLAKENSLDFIDNYSIFGSVSTSLYTTDGLHPNDLGYEVISRNIINSLEFN
ncbi:GDSL-type esterase/lipase family protein [Fictibacillus phosphorivorans]|uniref:GDSL-type esterase/lipase family protein n=1 Tax=Fictibacillus phosphorivorans TaxID=1221500 RepID=UPI003CEA545E